MATKRNGVYYIDRYIKGVGRVFRSLDTPDEDVANYRQSVILKLARDDRTDVLEAFKAKQFGIVELVRSAEDGSLRDLVDFRGNPQVSDMKDKFVSDRAAEIMSAARLGQSLTALIKWRPSIKVSNLDSATINQFKRHRLSSGCTGDGVARDLSAIHSFLEWHGGRALARRAFDEVRWPRQSARRTRRLSPDEIKRLLAVARAAEAASVFPYYSIYYTMLAAGLRPYEPSRVRPEDVDQENRLILIRKTKTAAGIRAIPVSDAAIEEALRMATWPRGFPKPTTLVNAFQRHRGRARIDDVILRDLRRTHAQMCREAEKDIIKVRDQLGHTSVEETEAYLGVALAEDRRAMVLAANERMGL